MKVCFETFGCRLNRAEALEEEAKYLAAGWTLTTTHSDADRIVIRGCSVTSRAQRDCEKLIHHLRRKYPGTRLVVQGCFRDDTAKDPRSAVGRAAKLASDNLQPLLKTADGEVPVPTRTARAYLKVQDGCSGQCAFCIVPQFRGKSVSVDFSAVLDKARRFIDAGYHEIVVTGCNLSLYASQGKCLPQLVAALAELGEGPSRCRIRLGSVEPGECADGIIQTMVEHENVCRFLHLTVQSGTNRILMAMKRPYSLNDVTDNIRRATSALPLIALGCDLMTGFPGESDLDYLATKTFLLKTAFSNVHVFPYSKRPGTLAAAFPGSVPREIRKSRAHELAAIADDKRTNYARQFIGREVEVLVEDEKRQSGWTSEYLWYEPRCVSSAERQPRKSLVKVRVHAYEHGWLR